MWPCTCCNSTEQIVLLSGRLLVDVGECRCDGVSNRHRLSLDSPRAHPSLDDRSSYFVITRTCTISSIAPRVCHRRLGYSTAWVTVASCRKRSERAHHRRPVVSTSTQPTRHPITQSITYSIGLFRTLYPPFFAFSPSDYTLIVRGECIPRRSVRPSAHLRWAQHNRNLLGHHGDDSKAVHDHTTVRHLPTILLYPQPHPPRPVLRRPSLASLPSAGYPPLAVEIRRNAIGRPVPAQRRSSTA